MLRLGDNLVTNVTWRVSRKTKWDNSHLEKMFY